MKKEITALDLIITERKEQIFSHGFDTESDKKYKHEELLQLSSWLIMKDSDTEKELEEEYLRTIFLSNLMDKLKAKTRKEAIIIAGSLIVAHLDMLLELED